MSLKVVVLMLVAGLALAKVGKYLLGVIELCRAVTRPLGRTCLELIKLSSIYSYSLV
jgi:uncharacterized membrane protein YccF (DUF307 family)